MKSVTIHFCRLFLKALFIKIIVSCLLQPAYMQLKVVILKNNCINFRGFFRKIKFRKSLGELLIFILKSLYL